jgi:hypothetical protein
MSLTQLIGHRIIYHFSTLKVEFLTVRLLDKKKKSNILNRLRFHIKLNKKTISNYKKCLNQVRECD